MLANDIGHVTITNIETTILKLLQVEDPAAKVLCELADLQNKLEMNYFNGTVAEKSPMSVISGYRLACKEAVCCISENLFINTDEFGRD
jgi:T-complex protein 1 subunit alpha